MVDPGQAEDDRAYGKIRRWQLASLKPEAMQLVQGGCSRFHPEFGIIFFLGDYQALVRSETHEGSEPLWTIDHERIPDVIAEAGTEQESLAPFHRIPTGRASVDRIKPLVGFELPQHTVVESHYRLDDVFHLIQIRKLCLGLYEQRFSLLLRSACEHAGIKPSLCAGLFQFPD